MSKLMSLLILALVLLTACGAQPEEDRPDAVESEAQSLPTATPLPTPMPAAELPKTELDDSQTATNAGETSPLSAPPAAAQSVSRIQNVLRFTNSRIPGAPSSRP